MGPVRKESEEARKKRENERPTKLRESEEARVGGV